MSQNLVDDDIKLTLKFEFITGQYHATQWGRNTNEGIIDWPPSPWRMLRAIISAWKLYANDMDDSEVKPILEEMCKSKVSFYIPNAIQSHIRHYVPINENTEKIIDSFIVVNKNQSLYAKWDDVQLTKDIENILDGIVSKIRYLGRAESWCKTSIYKKKILPNCVPLLNNSRTDSEDIIDIMVPTENATLNNLCVVASETYAKKKYLPEGSKIIQYLRPADCLTKIESEPNPKLDVEVVRYEIVGNVKPSIIQTIHVGDFIKRVVMSIYGKQNNGKISRTLAGKDENKNILKGHMHAYYLPTDENEDGKLDHLTIIAKKPFTKDELSALNIVNEIRYRHEWFNLVYQASGKIKDFRKIPILKSAKKWQSSTPFVLNRHMKVRKKEGTNILVDGPSDQLKTEIQKRFGDELKIKNIIVNDFKSKMKSGMKPIQFKRWRKNKLPGFGAYDVKIEFMDEVKGPLTFGHGSHFGLGMFVPVE